jgi:Leucine-rich repeat (LRR) protein
MVVVYDYKQLHDKNIIPDDCEVLLMRECFLSKLPELPLKLLSLFCIDNNLTKLPELPHNLKLLACSNNIIIELPKLPNRLTRLYCAYNMITELPELPYGLIEIYCNNNPIQYITPENYKIMKNIFKLEIMQKKKYITLNPTKYIDISNTILYDNSGCSSEAEFFGIG